MPGHQELGEGVVPLKICSLQYSDKHFSVRFVEWEIKAKVSKEINLNNFFSCSLSKVKTEGLEESGILLLHIINTSSQNKWQS